MAILPAATSRVSEPLKNQRLLGQLNADQIAIQRQFDQLSTGRRISRLSDDPAAAGRALILQRGISQVEQLSRNAGVAESFYSATDSTLGSLSDALTESRGATIEAAQNILSADERDALALTIRNSLQTAVAAGNSLFRDHQLLGGILQSRSALQFEGGEVVFNGTDAIAQTKVGNGTQIQVGVSGNEALGLANRFLEGKSLNAALDRSTPLIDLRGGQGVQPGSIRFSGGGNFVEVDLREATTIGDVVDLISEVSLEGRPLQATIQTNGISIAYEDGLPGLLVIKDASGDSLAKDLSILNADGTTAPPIVTTSLAPRVTTSTLLSRLAGGAGIDVSAGIQVTSGSKTVTVDLSQARNVSDVLIAINRSGTDVRAELNEATGGIELRALRSGVDYSVGENGGTAATSLGIRTATAEIRLSDLDKNRGIVFNDLGPEFSITRPDGTILEFNLEGAETVQDVLNLIVAHPLNQDPLKVIPRLNAVGNGIQLVGPPTAIPITIRRGDVSNAAEVLGLLGEGETEAQGFTFGAFALFNGGEFAKKEAGGTIDVLIRLEEAVREGDIRELERLQGLLDSSFDQSTRIRGTVGVWSRNADSLREAADNQAISLKSELSDEVDADLATVIAELQQRQAAQEASLKLIGQSARLTVLDFL